MKMLFGLAVFGSVLLFRLADCLEDDKEIKNEQFLHAFMPHDLEYPQERAEMPLPDDIETFRNLQHDMLRAYDRHMRPAKNQSHATLIDFYVYISHIEELNENEQTVSLHGWITMSWTDEMLDWSSAHPEIPRMILPQYYVWKPDLHLYNNARLRDHIVISWNTWVHIFRNGTVIFDPPFSLKATCDFDFQDYPWDTQNCALLLGSWSYLKTQLRWRVLPGSTSDFIGSAKSKGSNWDLIQAPDEQTFDFGTDYGVWHCIQINLRLKRNSGYLPILILLPIFVTSTILAFGFWIPAGGGLRLSIICMLLILEILHFAIVAARLPPAVFNGIPTVVRFCCFNIILTLLGFIISLISHHLSNRETTIPPPSRIMQILESAPLKYVFSHAMTSFKSSQYQHQQLVNNNEAQMMDSISTTDEHVNQRKLLNRDWCMLAFALDKTCFVVFSCAYAASWFVYVI